MPSLNNKKIFSNNTTNNAETERVQVQATREETIGFWTFISPASGATLEIRGAPDVEAATLTGVNGMLLHTIITSGTAVAGQTKVNTAGHAVVFLQALPLMWARYINGLAPTNAVWLWIVE